MLNHIVEKASSAQVTPSDKTHMYLPTSSGNMVTVDSKGRIVLPQEVRERLGIKPGTEVDIHEEDGKAVVEPEDEPEEIIERMERHIAAAATDRDAPDEERHPLAEDHAETIRRQATSDAADE
jgi:AbrB family looped-hinge helix DNA binding protein